MSGPPRILRALLWIYPPAYRRAYGEEMWEVVRHRHGCATSRAARTAASLGAALDLLWSAAVVWSRAGRILFVAASSGWGMDARFVLRSAGRNPSYAATTILVLGGAVAVTAAVFSFVRGTLLVTPTYPDPDRVVVGWGSNPVDGQIRDVVSGPMYLRLREGTTWLEALAAFHADDGLLLEDGRPAVLDVFSASVDFFDAVPVRPYLGRTFDERERTSSGPRSVLVSYAFWRDRLGADAEAVGSALPLNGEPHTIVGVLPEGFEFVAPAPVWAPLPDDLLAGDEPYRIHYHMVGRLRPGATATDATRDLTSVLTGFAGEFPGFEGWSVLVEPLHEVSVLAVRPALRITAGAVVLVLLVALVNLATLFRIRVLGRNQELGIRTALGSGGSRVARLLALEAAGLAGVGTTLGILLAPALLARVREMVPAWINIPDSAARVPALRAVLDPSVVTATAVMAVAGAVLLVAPAMRAAARGGRAAWGGRGRADARGTRWLVAAELALATVLCLGAGLTTRSARAMLATDVGLEDRGLLTLYFGDVWDRPVDEQVAYFEEVVRRVEAVPGVTSAALIDYVPFQGEDDYARVYFLDRSFQPVADQREEWRRVSHGLIETAGMAMLRGRSFVREDFAGKPRVAVVNESFARKHYPAGDALGRFVSTHDTTYRDMEIVGVAADVRSNGPAVAPPPILYVPLQGHPRGTTGMYVRAASGDPAALGQAVRDAVWSVDPSQPVDQILPMSALVDGWVAIPRAIRDLVAAVAAFALVLAALGVFGVVAYAVRGRTTELGVRMALGASPDRLRRDVLMGATPLVVWGVGGGLVAGVLAARAASAVLFQVEPQDPASLAGAAAVMSATAFLATYLPARRASRVSPTEAIRTE